MNERIKREIEINKKYIETHLYAERERDCHSIIYKIIALNFEQKKIFFVTCRFGRFILKIVSTQYINKKKINTIWNNAFEYILTLARYPQHRRYANRHIPQIETWIHQNLKKKQQQPLTTNLKKKQQQQQKIDR